MRGGPRQASRRAGGLGRARESSVLKPGFTRCRAEIERRDGRADGVLHVELRADLVTPAVGTPIERLTDWGRRS